MNYTAELFELPIDDPRHLQLRDDAWIGGPFFDGRYFLGKLLNSNEFNCSHEDYHLHMENCLKTNLPKTVWLLNSSYLHEFMIVWLKHEYRQQAEHRRFPFRKETREESAIVRIMNSPGLSDETIREELQCTEKTMKRWTMYKLLRREHGRLAKLEK